MEPVTKNHIGRKIGRIRELRGMKQEALASALGITQQAVSIIEKSETIDDERLAEVASALGITVEAIKNFSEEAVFNNTQNNYEGSVIHNGPTINHNCTFNPLDKVIELYERLLQAEKDKVAYLEQLMKSK